MWPTASVALLHCHSPLHCTLQNLSGNNRSSAYFSPTVFQILTYYSFGVLFFAYYMEIRCSSSLKCANTFGKKNSLSSNLLYIFLVSKFGFDSWPTDPLRKFVELLKARPFLEWSKARAALRSVVILKFHYSKILIFSFWITLVQFCFQNTSIPSLSKILVGVSSMSLYCTNVD